MRQLDLLAGLTGAYARLLINDAGNPILSTVHDGVIKIIRCWTKNCSSGYTVNQFPDWEAEVYGMDMAIVAVHLNGKRRYSNYNKFCHLSEEYL